MQGRALIVGAAVLAVALAGCHDEAEEDVRLAAKSLRLGDIRFSQSWPSFSSANETGFGQKGRTVSANLTVGPEVDLFGAKLLGTLGEGDPWLELRLLNDANVTVHTLRVERGARDLYGTVEDFFYFLDSTDVSPGDYKMRLEGQGNLSTVSLTTTLVDLDDPAALHTEEIPVPSDVERLRLSVSAEGWGSPPVARLRDAGGAIVTTLALSSQQEDAGSTVAASKGTWTLEVDAREFGGFVTVVVWGEH